MGKNVRVGLKNEIRYFAEFGKFIKGGGGLVQWGKRKKRVRQGSIRIN